jgi:hypothetical protein
MTFDEHAYSRHYDEIVSMAEFVELEDHDRTHPLTPSRVKALIAYSQSEPYARTLGRTTWQLPSAQLEQTVDAILSVHAPDLSGLEREDERAAADQFLIDGALLVSVADGVIDQEEIEHLARFTGDRKATEAIIGNLSNPQFLQMLQVRLRDNASILINKMSVLARMGLLRALCDVALGSRGLSDEEFAELGRLRGLLDIPADLAQIVLHDAKSDAADSTPSSVAASRSEPPVEIQNAELPSDPLDAVVELAKLPAQPEAVVRQMVASISGHNMPPLVALRTLVSWVIGASGDRGPLNEAQGKKLAIAAIRYCREAVPRSGNKTKARNASTDKLIRQYGCVALFSRNESVFVGANDRPHVVMSVSRVNGTLVIAPLDNLDDTRQVGPHELRKDPVEGEWPPEMSD